MKKILNFIRLIPRFYAPYCDYEYKPETFDFIIDNYEKVLCNRTHTMSKSTYYANDVINELDKYYKDISKETEK